MLVENLGTWPSTVGIEEQGTELGKEEDWNMEAERIMDKGGLKREMKQII